MAEIIEQSNEVLSETEAFSNLDDVGLDVAEETPEHIEEDVVEEAKAEIPSKFKGKELEDVIRSYQELEKEYGRRSNEIGELRKLADDLIKHKLNPESQPVSKKKVDVNDLLDDPERAIEAALENNPKLKQLEETLIAAKRAEAKKTLEARFPKVYDTVQSPEFQQWVMASPLRTKMFQEANTNFDYDTAGELMDIYYQLHDVRVKSAEGERDKRAKDAMKDASIEKGSSGQKSKKVFRRSDILAMIRDNPDKYYSDSFQKELSLAYAEKRVK